MIPWREPALRRNFADLQTRAGELACPLQASPSRTPSGFCDLILIRSDLDGDSWSVRHLLQRGTSQEQRDVVRGIVEEIRIDGETGEGVVVLRRVPEVPGNGASPERRAPGSILAVETCVSRRVAGGGFEPPTSGL